MGSKMTNSGNGNKNKYKSMKLDGYDDHMAPIIIDNNSSVMKRNTPKKSPGSKPQTRQSNKIYSERFKKLGDYESSLEFQWLPEAGLEAEVNDDLIIKRKRWQKSLKKDLYISEAIEILKDLSTELRGNNIIAEVKN